MDETGPVDLFARLKQDKEADLKGAHPHCYNAAVARVP